MKKASFKRKSADVEIIVDHNLKKYLILSQSSWSRFTDTIQSLKNAFEGTGEGSIEFTNEIPNDYTESKNMTLTLKLL